MNTPLSSNLKVAQELIALGDAIDDKGISETWPDLPWGKIGAAYEKLWEQKREIERLRAIEAAAIKVVHWLDRTEASAAHYAELTQALKP